MESFPDSTGERKMEISKARVNLASFSKFQFCQLQGYTCQAPRYGHNSLFHRHLIYKTYYILLYIDLI